METPSFLTTKQVAIVLGLTVQRVNALARSRSLGIALDNGYRIFTASDVEAMRERKPGRPKRTA